MRVGLPARERFRTAVSRTDVSLSRPAVLSYRVRLRFGDSGRSQKLKVKTGPHLPTTKKGLASAAAEASPRCLLAG